MKKEIINIYAELQNTNKQGYAPIVIRIDLNRRHIGTAPLHQKVNPAFWDKDLKLVKKTYPNAELINTYYYRP